MVRLGANRHAWCGPRAKVLVRLGADRLVICIDERRGCADSELPRDARIVLYKSRIDPDVVLSIIAG